MNIFIIIRKCLLSIFIIVWCASDVSPQVIYNGSKNVITIGKSLEYYIDKTSSQTIQTIQREKVFKNSFSDVPDLGLLDVPVWIKISIRNKSTTPDLMLEFDQSLLKNMDFYYPDNGVYKVNKSGELLPFNSRPNNYHKFIYELNIPFDSTIIYYARIKSAHKMQLPVFLGKTKEIENNNLVKNIFFGIFIGIILGMFFYNLFIYFVVKDSIYLYYVVYIFAVGLTQITIEGYAFQFLWPNNSFIATRSFFFCTALVNITGLEFVRKFLDTKKFTPRLDKVSYFLYAVYLIAIGLAVNGSLYISYQILQAFAGLVSIYILTISVIIAKRGYRPAQFFIIAWIPLILGILIWILKDFNILPYNIATNYSITIGSVLEVILLSFALADKINIYKKEKEASQEETVRALQENERIIREQNVMLEAKVNERTQELSDANTELNQAFVELKEAESQLVEAEKMASLGQLTAGIAHEINNPINFVTSNVKPLRRDIDILFGAIDKIEEAGLSEEKPEDKQKQITALKEEMDLDYLKTEINHLLKGIHEGASRTAEIVKGLRIFARLDEDDLKKADINEGLDSTLIIVNSLLNNKIQVKKKYGDIPLIECYPGKLNQVFLNIISNAIYAVKKRHQDRAGGEIAISTSSDKDSVFIKIADNGTGMDEATKKKIFEPFFTTKEVGEGTGLGMSIVYNTIKRHEGEIDIHSSPGVGTEFVIKLPVFLTILQK